MKVPYIKMLVLLGFVSSTLQMNAQQDPQFTQYMYNVMSVNPGYTGSRENLVVYGLHRTQWVGLDGAPQTSIFSADSPIGKNVGLGLQVLHDELGPSSETYLDVNFSYTLKVDDFWNLGLGLKAGGRFFNIDWSRGITDNPDIIFQQNVSEFFPTIGAGAYLYGERTYVGLSVPNIFAQDHYDEIQESVAAERLHFFFIAGHVFDLSQKTKFKPAAYMKYVEGTPLSVDLSANFMFNEKFVLGLAYRWNDSFSGLIGLQLTDQLHLGYAYDFTTSNLRNYNNGTHEIMLRFELKSAESKVKSPRFF
ncbi:PorP/SprF family type IX secretion system membrane protein [Spongiivirga citrea]|uniref:Type IX secretion system membrane protein PorP/SprF n=1 Tax=Spongiivirga citrea TaxID=1481457 RepID=A0A6M0CHN8_9FLAO|nr:type IX secretion system membrane protein PorP/SprF [Spongiivirga citrea]NER17476.1 type IX secretion system membrane protein PorP/SprF [Spongiivirga citrea]